MTAAEILSVLSDHGFSDTSTTRKVDVINRAIYDVCNRHPWPFLEKTLTLTFSGSSAVPSNWPSDFRAVLSLVDPSTGRVLEPMRLDEVEKKFAASLGDSGDPLLYFLIGRQLNVAPVPTSAATLRLRYLSVPTAITDASVEADIVIPKEYHDVIVMGALYRLYKMEDDPELAVAFQSEYETFITQMLASVFMREYDRPDHIHITDPDLLYDFD